MPNEFHQIIPLPPAEVEGTFAPYQVTSQFYREVRQREAWLGYCQWYYSTAARHRQELQQMRGELNILSWFRWGRNKK